MAASQGGHRTAITSWQQCRTWHGQNLKSATPALLYLISYPRVQNGEESSKNSVDKVKTTTNKESYAESMSRKARRTLCLSGWLFKPELNSAHSQLLSTTSSYSHQSTWEMQTEKLCNKQRQQTGPPVPHRSPFPFLRHLRSFYSFLVFYLNLMSQLSLTTLWKETRSTIHQLIKKRCYFLNFSFPMLQPICWEANAL